VIPKPGCPLDGYDLILASQPWRARMSAAFKAARILALLARSLAPRDLDVVGRLECRHLCESDRGRAARGGHADTGFGLMKRYPVLADGTLEGPGAEFTRGSVSATA